MRGKLLGGRYQVVDILARGGFGQTYIAEDIHRPGNPQCVVKHLLPNSANSRFLHNARRLFQAEAEILEKLGDHDQIPRLLAYFEENQEFYLAQEFIPGYTLRAELLADKRWTESQVYQLLQEVLGILLFVHGHGAIHRDIKPDNLIRRAGDNKLVLVDFGSVKQAWTQAIATPGQASTVLSTHVPATIAIGTPGYMPTEQGWGKPQPNSDLYALGMIAIQALTGKNPSQLLEESENGEIVWRDRANVSEALASVLTTMVRYNHKNRYQSAVEALAALKQIQIGDSRQENSEVESRKSEVESQNYSSPLGTLLATSQKLVPQSAENSSAIQINSLPSHVAIPISHKQPHLRLGAAITTAMVSVVAIYTINWSPLANTEKTLQQIPTLKAKANDRECAYQATTPRLDAQANTNAQTLRDECRLTQAKQLAAAKNFPAAIAAASKIPQTDASSVTARQLIAQWSNNLLQLATNQYRSGQIERAIASAKVIPPTSSVYPKAQKAIEQWQKKLDKNNFVPRSSKRSVTRQATQPAAKRVASATQTKARTTAIRRTSFAPQRPSRTIAKPSWRAVAKRSTRTIPKRLPISLTRKPVRTTTRTRPASVAKRPRRIVYKRATRSITKRVSRVSHKRITRSTHKRNGDKHFAQIKRQIQQVERTYRWIKKTVL